MCRPPCWRICIYLSFVCRPFLSGAWCFTVIRNVCLQQFVGVSVTTRYDTARFGHHIDGTIFIVSNFLELTNICIPH